MDLVVQLICLYSVSHSPTGCILSSVLHELDNTQYVFRLVENLMPYLGVSQRPVVAKRLQGSRTDTKLLADILIVTPAAEPSFLPFAEDFIHAIGEVVKFSDHFFKHVFRDNHKFIHCIYCFYCW